MAAVNTADVQLQATSPRLLTIPLATTTTVDFSQVNGATKPANNADVTTTILSNSGTAIVMTAAQLFKSSSGTGGVFIGSGGLVGKDGSGNTTFSINATTGAVNVVGSITGGSSLNITGSATFGGATTVGGVSYGGAFNTAYGATHGLVALTHTGRAVYGQTDSTSAGVGIGVHGDANAGTGVRGSAGALGIGVEAIGSNALQITGGVTFVNGSTTGTATATLTANKPGANGTFVWIPASVGGVAGRIPWVPD